MEGGELERILCDAGPLSPPAYATQVRLASTLYFGTSPRNYGLETSSSSAGCLHICPPFFPCAFLN
jgi:hypothetical protein